MRRQPARADRARPSPRLESLEDRSVPTVFANQVFAASAYQGLLGRNPTGGELAVTAGRLTAGVPAADVVRGVTETPEFGYRQVAGLYRGLLGRLPTLEERALPYWGGLLGAGNSATPVKAGLLASDEFFARAGGTPARFLGALFQTVLDRPVDAVATAAFGGNLGRSVGRQTVAEQVLGSPEANRATLDVMYREIFGRTLDADGLAFWGARLKAGDREGGVAAGLLASAESFGALAAATEGQTEPALAAFYFVTGRGLLGSGAGDVLGVQGPALGQLPFPVGFDATRVPTPSPSAVRLTDLPESQRQDAARQIANSLLGGTALTGPALVTAPPQLPGPAVLGPSAFSPTTTAGVTAPQFNVFLFSPGTGLLAGSQGF